MAKSEPLAPHLRAELEAQLTRQEIEAIQERAHTKNLEALVDEFVTQSDDVQTTARLFLGI